MSSSDNRKIAKNSLILYAQMLIVLVVGLYTSRVVLSVLGVVDYGIYNVVGGVIGLLTFLTSSLSAASARFIIYALGEGDIEKQKKTFANIMSVHLTLAIGLVLVGETIGLWFVINKLVIPPERLNAAVWAYHFSVFSFALRLISAPFDAAIVAHERMSAFAMMSVFDVFAKLVIVYLVALSQYDKLIVYALFILIIFVVERIIYGIYCTRNFDEVRVNPSLARNVYIPILKYASWMSIGNVAHFFNTQGLNILMNLFFGPAINAATGIAVMIQGQVSAFISNFQTALKPQIIKNYAEHDYEHLNFILISGTKFSFFIIWAIALPVILEIHQFLGWWLVEVPAWTSAFTIVMIATSCVSSLGTCFYQFIAATGDMKAYQSIQSGIQILYLPIAYVVLKTDSSLPYVSYILLFIVQVFCQIGNLYICLPKLHMPVVVYLKDIFIPVLMVLLLSSITPFFIRAILEEGYLTFFVVCFSAVVSVLAISYTLGCNKKERKKIIGLVMQRVHK